MIKRRFMAVVLIIVICMSLVPVNVFAIINETDTYDIELSGTSYNSSNQTYSYTNATNNIELELSVKVNGSKNYTVDSNNRITGISGSDEVTITITDTSSEYYGIIRGGGYSLGTPQKSDDNNTVTYTFKASELNDFTGNFMGLNVDTEEVIPENTNPNPPSSQEIPKVNDAIWFELWDELGNTLTYQQYNEIHDEWFMKIGATIMYSYDNQNWNELSNFNSDSNLTESNYMKGTMPRVTYCFNADTVYIKFTRILAGTEQGTGKRLEADFAVNKEVEVNKVYTFNQKNKTYGVAYDNGVRSLDWIYDMNIRDDAKEDMLVTNGKAKVIKVGNVTAEEYASQNQGSNSNNGGYWRIPEGETVTIELVPDYGYQLSSAALNGVNLKADDNNVSRFTFSMPREQVHFAALFTKVSDKIDVSARDVSSANVSGAENIVSSGNIQLDIADLDISDEMKAKFEEKAGESEIIQYLDLNLYNIVYKKADGTEVWSDKLEELNEEIIVTLHMSDDFVAESGTYYIIREHKGEYEELEAVYDKDTNTLTFKTDRFSEYAIALKTSDANYETNKTDNTPETTNPKTGDTVMIYVGILVVALLGSIVIIAKKVVSKKKNRH